MLSGRSELDRRELKLISLLNRCDRRIQQLLQQYVAEVAIEAASSEQKRPLQSTQEKVRERGESSMACGLTVTGMGW